MASVKEGMNVCQKCKGIREEVLEKCFVDAYELLCRNNNEVINNFMKKIEETARDTSNDTAIKKIQKKIEELNQKMSTLVDLHLEGNIDEAVYLKKKNEIDEKKEKLNHDLELLELDKNDEKSLQVGIGKIENILRNNQIMPEFDADVFEAIVKKVIIGKDEDPMHVCFVLKRGNELQDSAVDRHEKLIKENNEPDDKEQNDVLNFYSHQRVVNFEPCGVGKRKKIIDKIKVKVVY